MFEGIKRMVKKKDSNIKPDSLAGQSLEDVEIYNVNEQEETVKHR